MSLKLEADPKSPVIQIAAWLTFFHELPGVKNSVVGLKPEMSIRLPTHFRARPISDEARVALSCRNDQKSGNGIHSISQAFSPLKDPIDGGSHVVRQRRFGARVYVNKVDRTGTSRGEDAKIVALRE